ncbi:hypothetical protein PORY_000803 [Pneumocystis oryctolagi]|uniref:Uncharacterized protein n=1 Tax=Pneumocystis oryctolagi TaxID=42067 RepID=A0ACB7CE72_9ASCO|nr:hypothetical protein PORY_000803 [Pneumocystis oryctolagi]
MTSQGAIAPARAGAETTFEVIFLRTFFRSSFVKTNAMFPRTTGINVSRYGRLLKKSFIARRTSVFLPQINSPFPRSSWRTLCILKNVKILLFSPKKTLTVAIQHCQYLPQKLIYIH